VRPRGSTKPKMRFTLMRPLCERAEHTAGATALPVKLV
jgi:hypothetical protein